MNRYRSLMAFGLAAGLCLLVLFSARGARTQSGPKYKFDPDWPKPLPNKWKMGGVTGLAVDKDDNVWVLEPSERSDGHRARGGAHSSDCRLLRAASVDDPHRQERQRHRFDSTRRRGTAWTVDSKGFVYHRTGHASASTIRKPARLSAKCRARRNRQPGGGGGRGRAGQPRVPGRGSTGPVADF